MIDCGGTNEDKSLKQTPDFSSTSLRRKHCSMSDINFVVISHYHSDHCAGLMELVKQSNYNNPIYMTPGTLTMFKQMIISSEPHTRPNETQFEELVENHNSTNNDPNPSNDCLSLVRVVDCPGSFFDSDICVTLLPSGHCQGSAMVLIASQESHVHFLFTGDCCLGKPLSPFYNWYQPLAPAFPKCTILSEGTFTHIGGVTKSVRLAMLLAFIASKCSIRGTEGKRDLFLYFDSYAYSYEMLSVLSSINQQGEDIGSVTTFGRSGSIARTSCWLGRFSADRVPCTVRGGEGRLVVSSSPVKLNFPDAKQQPCGTVSLLTQIKNAQDLENIKERFPEDKTTELIIMGNNIPSFQLFKKYEMSHLQNSKKHFLGLLGHIDWNGFMSINNRFVSKGDVVLTHMSSSGMEKMTKIMKEERIPFEIASKDDSPVQVMRDDNKEGSFGDGQERQETNGGKRLITLKLLLDDSVKECDVIDAIYEIGEYIGEQTDINDTKKQEINHKLQYSKIISIANSSIRVFLKDAKALGTKSMISCEFPDFPTMKEIVRRIVSFNFDIGK